MQMREKVGIIVSSFLLRFSRATQKYYDYQFPEYKLAFLWPIIVRKRTCCKNFVLTKERSTGSTVEGREFSTFLLHSFLAPLQRLTSHSHTLFASHVIIVSHTTRDNLMKHFSNIYESFNLHQHSNYDSSSYLMLVPLTRWFFITLSVRVRYLCNEDLKYIRNVT